MRNTRNDIEKNRFETMEYHNIFANQQIPVIPEGKDFLVWLSHDVDRVQKTCFHALYYWGKKKQFYHLRSLFSKHDPYWNFERIMDLEDRYDARSTFFFLNESMRADICNPKSFILAKGRYRIEDPKIQAIIRELDQHGWEIGLHGSYHSYRDQELLCHEKTILEQVVGHAVIGSRQHYWNNAIPETWNMHRALGLKYDATLVKKHDVGFYQQVYFPFKPFDDDFTVIPTVIMERYLFQKARDLKSAQTIIDDLITFCQQKHAILSVLWHQYTLRAKEFPEYYMLYVYLLQSTKERNGAFMLPDHILKG